MINRPSPDGFNNPQAVVGPITLGWNKNTPFSIPPNFMIGPDVLEGVLGASTIVLVEIAVVAIGLAIAVEANGQPETIAIEFAGVAAPPTVFAEGTTLYSIARTADTLVVSYVNGAQTSFITYFVGPGPVIGMIET